MFEELRQQSLNKKRTESWQRNTWYHNSRKQQLFSGTESYYTQCLEALIHWLMLCTHSDLCLPWVKDSVMNWEHVNAPTVAINNFMDNKWITIMGSKNTHVIVPSYWSNVISENAMELYWNVNNFKETNQFVLP